MDSNVVVAILSVTGIIIAALIAQHTGKGKAGITPAGADASAALVNKLATAEKSMTIDVGPALVALSQMYAKTAERLTEAEGRVTQLETHEQQYLTRIAALEEWGKWSTEQPPRTPPPWVRPGE